jgi:outer membrane protein assembly factor BamB
LYQNTLYVNTGSDIRAYATRNGALERTYPLADVGNPTILNGVLYASNTTSTFALCLSDGKLLWRVPFGFATPPNIVNGILYASSDAPNSSSVPDRVVYALRVNDGKVLWQYRFDNQYELPSVPLVIQGVVYFSTSTQLHQTIDARIYALKATDGSLLWHQLLGHTAISNVETDGSAFYVFVDGFVEAFHTNGRVMWHTHLPISSLVGMQNTFLAVVANDVIYVQGNGTFYALRATDGTLLWHYQTTSAAYFSSFNVQGNVLYVGMLPFSALGNSAYRPSFLLALCTDNGHLLWQKQLAEQEILNPTVEGGVIYVVYGLGNGQEALSALRTTDGHFLWTHIFPIPS